MSKTVDRRHFLGVAAASGTAAGLALSASATTLAATPSNRVILGVMGLSRGAALAAGGGGGPLHRRRWKHPVFSFPGSKLGHKVLKGVKLQPWEKLMRPPDHVPGSTNFVGNICVKTEALLRSYLALDPTSAHGLFC